MSNNTLCAREAARWTARRRLLAPSAAAAPDAELACVGSNPQVLGRDPTARPVDSPLPAPDLTRVEAMRVRVEAELRAEIEKLNVSAPAEGQALFTQLSKQYRCGWDDVHIVIDDFAILRAPYGLENVEKLPGSRATDEALARIRKVIAVAWSKIGRPLAAPGK